MTLKHSVLIIVIGFAVWVFRRQLALAELAFLYAQAFCQKNDVQLLDQSIAMAGIKFKKLTRGGFGLEREYHFEFTSTGEQRYTGRIFMIGQTIVKVNMDAFREPV